MEDLVSPTIIIHNSLDLLWRRVRLHDPELAFHALLILLTILSLYLLIALDCLKELRLYETSLLFTNLAISTRACLAFKSFDTALEDCAKCTCFFDEGFELLFVLSLYGVVYAV